MYWIDCIDRRFWMQFICLHWARKFMHNNFQSTVYTFWNMRIHMRFLFDLYEQYCSLNIIRFENKWANFVNWIHVRALYTSIVFIFIYACIFGTTMQLYIHYIFIRVSMVIVTFEMKVPFCIRICLYLKLLWRIDTNRNPYFKVIYRQFCSFASETHWKGWNIGRMTGRYKI